MHQSVVFHNDNNNNNNNNNNDDDDNDDDDNNDDNNSDDNNNNTSLPADVFQEKNIAVSYDMKTGTVSHNFVLESCRFRPVSYLVRFKIVLFLLVFFFSLAVIPQKYGSTTGIRYHNDGNQSTTKPSFYWFEDKIIVIHVHHAF